jgi:hypothetical protein
MIDQVASVHKEFGMSFFHIGAGIIICIIQLMKSLIIIFPDEVFQTGICNDTIEEMRNRGGRDRLILWHIYRTANHVLSKFNVYY